MKIIIEKALFYLTAIFNIIFEFIKKYPSLNDVSQIENMIRTNFSILAQNTSIRK